MWKWSSVVLAVMLALLFGYIYYYGGDNKLVEEAILLINKPDSPGLQALDYQYALAKSKALAIRSKELRDRTLVEVDKTYSEKKAVFEEAEELKLRIAALMQRDYTDLSSLRSARAKAEELASKIRLTGEAADLLATISDAFTKQQEVVAERIEKERRRRAEEDRRRAEALRIEAEKNAETKRLELARAQAEAERQRFANEAAQQRRRAEPTDCCCKTKVDRGAIFTKWVFEYKRLDKKKCTKPGFWDAHAEGWCVPDSSCY